jgi:oligoribonuclease NrnB/cAMP/cGMP phosphodiesterase (DHH superfamily)
VKSSIVFYHDNCTDGFGSAYIANTYFKDEAYYIAVNHKPVQEMEPLEALNYLIGSLPIKVEDYFKYDIYVLDYSFPVSHFVEHIKLFKNVTILDHHKSTIDSYKKLFPDFKSYDAHGAVYEHKSGDNYIINLSKTSSATKLTYEYFYGRDGVPYSIELISDSDLLKFIHADDSRVFYLYLQSLLPWTFAKWDFIMDEEKVKKALVLGKNLLEKRTYEIEQFIKNQVDIIIPVKDKKLKGKAVNAPSSYSTDIGEVINKEGHDYCVIWTMTKSKKILCSIRSKNNFDVEEIANYYGGGGNKNSSGFTVSLETFTQFLI